ncbi:MAG TPA: LUD domain-containing protein [Gaiella sp.]|nr:LUD domain-containing protein [Gaiella sp.]
MSAARETVLGRIREALANRPAAPDIPRDYRSEGSRSPADVVELFVERVEETGAVVVHASEPDAAVAAVLAEHGASRVVVAHDLPASLRPTGLDVVEDVGLSPVELDGLDAAVTTCAAACAETGTIAFDGGEGQGRRAITLVPDLHVCVVRRDQVLETVPELFQQLAGSAREGRPIILVSGPSATSDIELERVEGVHGPRRLVVVLEE